MAVDIFLKIEGIEGESKDDKHPKEIEVLSWSWELNQSGTMHHATGGGSGKVTVEDVVVEKWIDSATNGLVAALTSGKHLKKSTLTVRKAGGPAQVEYYKIEMNECIITRVAQGESFDDDERIREKINLNFASVKVIYQPQDNEGKPLGGEKTAGWDMQKNIKL